jgi:hypothetical protein
VEDVEFRLIAGGRKSVERSDPDVRYSRLTSLRIR